MLLFTKSKKINEEISPPLHPIVIEKETFRSIWSSQVVDVVTENMSLSNQISIGIILIA